MNKKDSKLFYPFLIFMVICSGLLSRRMSYYIPNIINLYLGDSLWALMIFLVIRMFFRTWSIKKTTIVAILFCYSIEISQLYHADWIDMIRRTTLGGLVLGYGFLWTDLMAYLLGIGLGIIIEAIINNKRQ